MGDELWIEKSGTTLPVGVSRSRVFRKGKKGHKSIRWTSFYKARKRENMKKEGREESV